MYRFPRLRQFAKSVLPERARRAAAGVVKFDLWFDLDQAAQEIERSAALYARATPRIPRTSTDELTLIAGKYRPTKMGLDYLRHYWLHFAPIRDEVQKVVEIGVHTPASMRMWEEFFPNAMIYGIDIDENCRDMEGGRRRVFIGNQRDEGFLREFIERTGGAFDIVIDDGEHSDFSVLKSFAWLFPALTDHGIYAIEDLLALKRALRFFRALEEKINYWPEGVPFEKWPELASLPEGAGWLARNITGIHFHRFLCLVNRGHNPEDNPYLRR
jgi:hypothetical protein